MNCTQICLTNTLLYTTPNGPLYINNTQLAYYRLRNRQQLPYSELNSIIANAKAPNGLWFAYYRNGHLRVVHHATNGTTSVVHEDEGNTKFTDADLHAVYPSMEDVMYDFPEYFI